MWESLVVNDFLCRWQGTNDYPRGCGIARSQKISMQLGDYKVSMIIHEYGELLCINDYNCKVLMTIYMDGGGEVARHQ